MSAVILLDFFFTPKYIPENDQRDEAVILSHICWGPGAPPSGRPPSPPPPPTQPPPPPSLKVAGKCEGVSVWTNPDEPPVPPSMSSVSIQESFECLEYIHRCPRRAHGPWGSVDAMVGLVSSTLGMTTCLDCPDWPASLPRHEYQLSLY